MVEQNLKGLSDEIFLSIPDKFQLNQAHKRLKHVNGTGKTGNLSNTYNTSNLVRVMTISFFLHYIPICFHKKVTEGSTAHKEDHVTAILKSLKLSVLQRNLILT